MGMTKWICSYNLYIIHKWGFFLYFSRGHHKVEEACEMYCRAANMFKMAKNWSGAASCLFFLSFSIRDIRTLEAVR